MTEIAAVPGLPDLGRCLVMGVVNVTPDSFSDGGEHFEAGRAIEHGLDLRPLDDSVDDVLEWWGERPWPENWLTSGEEATLLEL